jgi:adenylate cyclase
MATLSALLWARTSQRIDRIVATLAIIGLGIIGINLLSWNGTFWAAWPLLGIAVVGGIRWFTRQRVAFGIEAG